MSFPRRWKIREKYRFCWCESRHERSPRRQERFCQRRRPSTSKNEKTPLESPTPAAHCRHILIDHPSRTTYDLPLLGYHSPAQFHTVVSAAVSSRTYVVSCPARQPPTPRRRSLLIANTDILLPHCIGQISSRGHAYSAACHLKWNSSTGY